MSRVFDYTRFARRFATRFPTWNYLLIQINFWITAYVFLALVTYLAIRTFSPLQSDKISLPATLITALFLGFFTGLTSGYIDLLLEKRLFHHLALGTIILIKGIISFFVFVILISLVRYSIYPFLTGRLLKGFTVTTQDQSWDYFFQLLLIFNIVAGLVISLINQVNKKFGPGVLVPLLFGKYRSPKEEERIFLFMDLKSSTAIAESLGHLKYSSFIRDSFMDINSLLSGYNAQIYQYVGDEVVLTWTIEEGLTNLSCIRFFFACEAKFKKRSAHYIGQFGQIPAFKAGLHMGKVTAVEVGDIKRDIAYHGDTLNTAARIQSVCNQYNKTFLTSLYVVENSEIKKHYQTEIIGLVNLKGKSQPVAIVSIDGLIA